MRTSGLLPLPVSFHGCTRHRGFAHITILTVGWDAGQPPCEARTR
jgi:hypothetical protein